MRSVSLYRPELLALKALAKSHGCGYVTDFITLLVDRGVPTDKKVWVRSEEREPGTVTVKDEDSELLRALAFAHDFSVPDLLRDVIAGNWSLDNPPRERCKTWVLLYSDNTWKSFEGTRTEAQKQVGPFAILALP